MKRTARAAIIQNGKVLLVTAHNNGYYWLPGGTVEDGETMLEALYREIDEELGATLKDVQSYRSYKTDDREVEVFTASLVGDITIGNEVTAYAWYTQGSNVIPGEKFKETVLADLISDELVR